MIKLKYIRSDVKERTVNSEGAIKFAVGYCFVHPKDIVVIHRQQNLIKCLEDDWKDIAYREYCTKHNFKVYNIVLSRTANSTCNISNVILTDDELKDLIDVCDYENR